MGDYSAPKRRDVVDRLRRRLEHYRQHQLVRNRRFNEGYSSLYDEHRQQAQLLHHRWLESKAKKAKQSRQQSKQDNSSQGEHRNLVVTKKLKPKLDSGVADNNAAESAYNFDEQDSPVNKNNIGVDGNQLPQLSVKIVQQINSRPENSQTIHTNVTVSTKTFGSTDSPKPSVSSVHTSVECKQEPAEDSQGHSDKQCSGPASQDHIFDDVEELQSIINTLEKEEGEIPADIIKELTKFEEICDNVKTQCESQSDMFGPLQSPGVSKPFPESGTGVSSMCELNSVPMRTPSMSSMSEATGPAAETLKQMAAQHQNQSHSPGYPMKSPSIDSYPEANYPRGNGYVNFQQQQSYSSMQQQHGQSQSGNFPFPPQSHMGDAQTSPPQYPQHLSNKDMMGYGGTKPLTHFSDHGNGQQPQPSSLQQLQNQVRSHFNQSPNPQMQITQTQHMQVSHGHMQLSQTQQLQMQQPPQQISLTQQQSFSMSPHPQQSSMGSHPPTQGGMPPHAPSQGGMPPHASSQGGMPPHAPSQGGMPPHPPTQGGMPPHPPQGQQSQMMNEQMNIQMMEKMREQRQMHIIDQQSQQGQMPPQYMNRPPPEYKVPPVSTTHMHPNASGQYGNTAGGGGPNPLRTMQNMVNQTYGVKSEVTSAQTQNGMMQAAHLSAMQSMSTSGGGPPQMQRQYQGANGQNLSQAVTRAQSSSTYTSAIMRNQRPPNVNVGPDGLNISQPRTQEWPRPMMPGTRHPGQASMTQAAAMSAMQYGHYPNSAAATSANMMQQQQQRPQMNSMPGQTAMMQNNVMMQQNVQMAQRVSMRPGVPNTQAAAAAYNMSSSVAMATGNVPPGGIPSSATQGQSGYPATSSAQDDFMMNYLDNPQNTSPDFFDSIVQGSDNFNLLDEILGKQ